VIRIYIIASAICLWVPIAAVSATNSAVSVHAHWVDWPNKEARKQAEEGATYQDSKLEADLATSMRKTLAKANIPTRFNADLVVQIKVAGTTIDRRYTDSLFGTLNNRPTEYAGSYTAEVQLRGETISRHSEKFSFKSSYGSGQTSTTISKMKVIGLINDWLTGHIETRKFRKALVSIPMETSSGFSKNLGGVAR
jgi:hypothetical protein